MKILSIETSCDETAVSIVEASGSLKNPSFKVLGNALFSQIEIHREYGGVYPALAKREHAKNLIPLLNTCLQEANMVAANEHDLDREMISTILEREPELATQFLDFISTIDKPAIDAIAVTYGPGLEPALWVGINFARALSAVWDIPIIPVNHMEGHIASVLMDQKEPVQFPLLALLISGGHTEIVLAKKWGEYEVLGSTRDDAVGEAFDKVARLLDLPYPGGPEISRLAGESREGGAENPVSLPRPMLTTDDFDFSFSGLKTAVLYTVKDQELTNVYKGFVAREFEDAATEVLVTKTRKALRETGAQTLIVAGGVAANSYIRKNIADMVERDVPETTLLVPDISLSTDNAIMIALAGFIRRETDTIPSLDDLRAKGNLSLE